MSLFPTSLRDINKLPDDEKLSIYRTLIPDWIYSDYGIDPITHEVDGYPVIRIVCPKGSRVTEIDIRRQAHDRDSLLYLHMTDTFNNQLLVLLVVVNDMDAPRYNTDVDAFGNSTNFGTSGRNVPAEIAAMKAGLAPGQIRRGLRAFKRTVPLFEQFVHNIGHDMFLIEPLSYHNAVIFERYGFNYMRGLQTMREIDTDFQPGGTLHNRLTPDNPFRYPDAWQTIRKRSWAIHDGILGHPFTGFQMYKRIGIHAGVCTFPNAHW